ncbi:hypothetical protein KsCSTR_34650 [Candidatus Kuenenia stuttgartiensis]|uniref:DUF6298 domain-containing protein n=1 Tax=Kuenenia stuttgartiensis TaxID=174633 RepID=Q1Q708_KUEST|nr:DUF6298 domain-containing protein [Candidatus Kuenenia stuttgartiensis]QII12844.1 hypothetical protein KsCSTR_34650 [Candidatus Kuenenia stuttgartiensis]CAJ73351.1 unknown protein [Candidatus Kuenenia stuttgartiensis]
MIEYRLFIYVVFLYIFTNSFTTCFSNSFIHADSINIKATLVPLKINTYNPRYFTGGSGKAIYLTGSHNWANLKDKGKTDPPPAFDFNGYLDFLQRYNHNFMRLWTWGLTKNTSNKDGSFYFVTPFPWLRSGHGLALDGKPKFDLSLFDQTYFDRLRSRVIAARDREIYVSIMLFEGWGMFYMNSSWRWDGHPFNVNNNINGIDGDPNKDGKGLESHTLQIPFIIELQEEYVKKVIDTVNDMDNVLYEISNEDHADSVAWQYHMINFIHAYEGTKPMQHPVGMTTHVGLGNNVVFDSAAEWISPTVSTWGDNNDPYKVNPPVADGSKVNLLDTDHLWGMGGDRVWVWKSFLRGYNPIYMDDDLDSTSDAVKEEARKAMGHTLTYASKMNLNDMPPRNDLTSTTYCLANPGFEYLVYKPYKKHKKLKIFGCSKSNTLFTVNLAEGRYRYEWFNPGVGEIVSTGTFTAKGGNQSFNPPFDSDAVLYISADKER